MAKAKFSGCVVAWELGEGRGGPYTLTWFDTVFGCVRTTCFADEMANEVLFTCYQASLPPINILPLIEQLQKVVKAVDFGGASYPRKRFGKEASKDDGCG